MKKTGLSILLFIGCRSFSQIPELAEGNDKPKFEISTKNSPSTISAAKIIIENIFYCYPAGNNKTDSVLNAVIQYDSSGRITTSTEFRGKDTLTRRYQYLYDETGNITKKSIQISEYKGRVHHTEIDYNKDGLEIVKYDYDEDSVNMSIIRKEYNLLKQCTALTYMDKDGTFKTAKKFDYDTRGNLIQAHWFFLSSATPAKTIFFNRSDNDLTEDIYVNSDKIVQYKYDTKGHCTEEEQHLLKTSSGRSNNDYVITTSGKDPFGINNLTREFSMSGSNFNMALAGGDLSNSLLELGDSKSGISTINISKPESDGVTNDISIKKYHFYNDDGTIRETRIFVSGESRATIIHHYQTR